MYIKFKDGKSKALTLSYDDGVVQDIRLVSILDKYGVKYTRREAVQLESGDYEKYDLFVGMDMANVRNMQRIFGSDPKDKILRLLDLTSEKRDVADPWYTGNFEVTYRDINEGCEALLEYLLK